MKTTFFTLTLISAVLTTMTIGTPNDHSKNFKIQHSKATDFVPTNLDEKISHPQTMNLKGSSKEDPFAQIEDNKFNSDFVSVELETGNQDSYKVDEEFVDETEQLEGGTGIGPNTLEDEVEHIEKRSVQGRDSREQTRHTKDYPHRMIGQLYFKKTSTSGWYICSATLVNYRSILTNGHCVCSGAGKWYNNFRFYPARDADGGYFGTYISGIKVYTTSNYFRRRDYTYDYAVIQLKYSIGKTLGWMGLWAISDKELSNSGTKSLPLLLEGYPGDKPSGTNWFGACNVYVKNYASIYHTCDTAGGQSGSALSTISRGYRYIIGVHNLGYSGTGYNRAVRLSSSRYKQIKSWLN